jgi:site-specific recombinase XerD
VSSGANVKALQKMLGHASVSMTLDRYADLFDEDDVSIANAVNAQILDRVGSEAWSVRRN